MIRNPEEEQIANDFLHSLIDLARLPKTITQVYVGKFRDIIKNTPEADLNIFGVQPKVTLAFIERMVKETNASCIFVGDSGHESALA